MHKSVTALKLMFALAIGALQTASPALADPSYSLLLAECQFPKQQADAELVSRNQQLVTNLRIFNDISEYREYANQARAGYQIKKFSNFKPALFDTKKTEVVFDFDRTTSENGIAMVFGYKNQVGNDHAVLFSSNPADKNVFKLVKNQDGSFTGTVTSAPLVAKGIPANADINFVALIYQPTIPKKTRSQIFIRSIQFLGESTVPNIKAGVGGCELLGDAGNLVIAPNR
ncbi:MAG: hypothetical protein JST89_06215 [Cyanobacteria bacterium SZAS-4]|nr:hypothetical protein [Cyanobacteria bacterium SZAS-4]